MKIGNESIRHAEIIRGKDKLVRPPVERVQVLVRRDRTLDRPHACGTDRANLFLFVDRPIDHIACLLRNDHLLGIHLVFREILDIDFTKITQARMKGEVP